MQKIRLLLQKKQHQSVFIAVLSLGFIVGVAFALLPSVLSSVSISWLAGAALLLVLCFWRRATWMLALVLIAGVIFGVVRSLPDRRAFEYMESIVGQSVQLRGTVSDDVDTGKKNDQRFKLTNLEINNEKISGTIWVSSYDKVQIKRGYRVGIEGILQKGFGSFSASMFRADVLHIIDPHLDKAREARDSFSERVKKYIREPEASLGIGFLVGQKSALPPDFETALRIVGLTHIVVASGYNLTILVRFTRRIFARISKYLATVTASLTIAGFILVTGFSPSMTRAGLVAGLSLVAWYYGRTIHPLILLPFAAALSLLINPSFLWGDLGWHLSFAAFTGVMIAAPLLQHFFFGPEKPKAIRQILGETLSAQIFTLPIIAFSFGTVSVFALPANLLVLPLVPLAMALVAICGLASLVAPVFAPLAAFPAQTVLSYMTSVVDIFSSNANASLDVDFGLSLLIGSYCIIFCTTLFLWYKTKHSFRGDNLVE